MPLSCVRGYVILLGNPSSHGGTFFIRGAGHSSQLTASAGTGAPQLYVTHHWLLRNIALSKEGYH